MAKKLKLHDRLMPANTPKGWATVQNKIIIAVNENDRQVKNIDDRIGELFENQNNARAQIFLLGDENSRLECLILRVEQRQIKLERAIVALAKLALKNPQSTIDNLNPPARRLTVSEPPAVQERIQRKLRIRE